METRGEKDHVAKTAPDRTGVAALNDDLEFWMTQFPAALKNIPIIYLAIPGTFEFLRFTRHACA